MSSSPPDDDDLFLEFPFLRKLKFKRSKPLKYVYLRVLYFVCFLCLREGWYRSSWVLCVCSFLCFVSNRLYFSVLSLRLFGYETPSLRVRTDPSPETFRRQCSDSVSPSFTHPPLPPSLSLSSHPTLSLTFSLLN